MRKRDTARCSTKVYRRRRFSLSRVLGTWLVLAVTMSANGVFRELVLRPALGSRADVLSAVLGVAIIVLITRWLLRTDAPLPIAGLVGVSALLVNLTVAFEFLVGRYVDGKSWSELAATTPSGAASSGRSCC